MLGTQLSREEIMLLRKWTELKDRETEHEKKKWCQSPDDVKHYVMTSASDNMMSTSPLHDMANLHLTFHCLVGEGKNTSRRGAKHKHMDRR